ncbi:MAG: glycosyltransferase [Bacteroidia bacterium]|nr:glycosyltransferase [Bacteroidia bacterium]
MKILLVNTFDRGGAAKACIRLHYGLLDRNINSSLLLMSKNGNSIPSSYQYSGLEKKRTIKQKLRNKVKKVLNEFHVTNEGYMKLKQQQFLSNRNPYLEMFSFPDTDIDITNSLEFANSDLVHLHWVTGFLDYSSFFKKSTKPVVWTLHDMNPFAGGEHYVEQYCGIDDSGKPIPRKVSQEENATFENVLKIKSEALKDVENLHIVVLCNWMAQEVKKSQLFSRFPITIIPNGLDTNIFTPRDKVFSRDMLGIPQNKTVFLFVSDVIENYRKGYDYLLRALDVIKNKDIVLCSVGQKSNELITSETLIELGSIHDERFMSIIYSAADVFIIPSIMDNLPNTVLESLLCGTPVIGFPVGGMTDMIQNGENGYLADDISVDSLVSVLNKYIDKKDVFEKENIVTGARKKYSLDVMSAKYIELYKKILNE